MITDVQHHEFAANDHRFDVRTENPADADAIVTWANHNNVWFEADVLGSMHLIEVRTADRKLAMTFKMMWCGA